MKLSELSRLSDAFYHALTSRVWFIASNIWLEVGRVREHFDQKSRVFSAFSGFLQAEPIFLAHAENRLCGIPVLFPLSTCCQLPSYNRVGSYFNHLLTVFNSIKRAAHIENWFKPVVSSKLLHEANHEYRRVYFPSGRAKLALLAWAAKFTFAPNKDLYI